MAETEGVIFSHSVKAFIDQVVVRRGLLDKDLRRELTALGIDLDKPKDIPLAPWLKALEITAARLQPGASRELALEEVGREMFRGFVNTVVGRALLLVMKLQGPRRTLHSIANSYKSADSVTKVTTREVSPTEFELTFVGTGGVPTYKRGLLLEVFAQLGVNATVTYAELPGDREVFTAKW